MSYDVLDELVQWNAGSTSQEWYAYDNAGGRILKRSTTGSGTSLTVYAFGTEEHAYSASGVSTGNTYYYSLAGRLIGKFDGGSNTQFFLTDALGSVLSTFKDVASTAAVLGNQAYGPYGNSQYHSGSLGTAKGFTGQYQDATGLDYYNARFYDPVVGRFVSADTVVGNGQGDDPYAYVGGNPETFNDPSGHHPCADDGCSAPSGYFANGGMTNGGWADNPPQLGGGNSSGGGQNYCIGYNCYNSVGQWLYSTYHPAAYQTPVQVHTNPKVVQATPPSCDDKCGNDDRKFIKDHFADQKAYAANVSTAIGDGVALIGDIISTVLHLLAEDYAGAIWELTSTLLRAAAVVGDLGKLKIFSMPPWVADILSGLKWVASIMDILTGAFGWANPLTGTVNLFGKWVIDRVKLQGASAIAQYIASAASGAGTIAFPNFITSPYWDAQSSGVDSYSNQHAHDVCVQLYPSANLCQ